MFHQRTIAEKVTCTGLGLHSGAPVQLTLHPASADTGIVFVRERHGEAHEIAARAEWLSSTAQATTLARGGLSVATVEHLLAALAGHGIDNVRVELDGEEVPVLDGSAEPFCYLLESAGVFTQSTPRRVIGG